MNSRRAFRETVKTNGEGSTPTSVLPALPGTLRLFILFFFLSGTTFAQNIQTQQYDINDPRNPNCPCHKLQKQADDAYQQMLNNDEQVQNKFVQNFSDNNNNTDNHFNRGNFNPFDNVGQDNSSHKQKIDFNFNSAERPSFSGGSGTRIKKKKPGTAVVKKINRTRLKHSRIKKVRPNYAVCYKW